MSRTSDIPSGAQHLVMEEVSWAFYEHVLEQVGDDHLRVTFCDGRIEMISPILQHEVAKCAIRSLVGSLTFELGIPLCGLGSTTFRRQDRQAGLEPYECFYIANEERARGMERFDPRVHAPPDLAVDIDIYEPWIAHDPIYARLGVSEVWHYDGRKLSMRHLDNSGTYVETASHLFPFLPTAGFTAFIERMIEGDRTSVALEFRKWVRKFRSKLRNRST